MVGEVVSNGRSPPAQAAHEKEVALVETEGHFPVIGHDLKMRRVKELKVIDLVSVECQPHFLPESCHFAQRHNYL
jgi:hypothetical protein